MDSDTGEASLGLRIGLNNIGVSVIPPGGGHLNHYTVMVLRKGPAPELERAFVRGNELILQYDLELKPAGPGGRGRPPENAFTVTVDGNERAVTGTRINGRFVTLTLPGAVSHRSRATVSYTVPDMNPLQTATEGLAPPFAELRAANRTPPAGPGTGERNGRELFYTVMTVGEDLDNEWSGYTPPARGPGARRPGPRQLPLQRRRLPDRGGA